MTDLFRTEFIRFTKVLQLPNPLTLARCARSTSPLRGEVKRERPRCALPLPGGERVGVRGFGRFRK
jgi:hypothetical protein